MAIGVLLSATTAAPAGGQRLSENRAGVALALPASPQLAGGGVLNPSDRKEPRLAGGLSLIIPGVGSFYAGSSRHGLVHLGIHIASIVVAGEGLRAVYDDGEAGMWLLGIGALLVNDVWSIFTAVGDASAHNAKGPSGRAVGESSLAPAVRRAGYVQASPETSASPARVRMQVLKVSF